MFFYYVLALRHAGLGGDSEMRVLDILTQLRRRRKAGEKRNRKCHHMDPRWAAIDCLTFNLRRKLKPEEAWASRGWAKCAPCISHTEWRPAKHKRVATKTPGEDSLWRLIPGLHFQFASWCCLQNSIRGNSAHQSLRSAYVIHWLSVFRWHTWLQRSKTNGLTLTYTIFHTIFSQEPPFPPKKHQS